MHKRGFEVMVSHSVEMALLLAQENPPEYAVVDLKMCGASALLLVEVLISLDKYTLIVVLTGYASIPAAVTASAITRRGATICRIPKRHFSP